MAYAFIRGAELPALQYYESLLANTLDTNERSKIEGILQAIKENLEKPKDQPQRTPFVNVPANPGSVNQSAPHAMKANAIGNSSAAQINPVSIIA